MAMEAAKQAGPAQAGRRVGGQAGKAFESVWLQEARLP